MRTNYECILASCTEHPVIADFFLENTNELTRFSAVSSVGHKLVVAPHVEGARVMTVFLPGADVHCPVKF